MHFLSKNLTKSFRIKNVLNHLESFTLVSLINVLGRLHFQGVFSPKKLLIRHQPIYFKRKFHPRQDVYYILFAILFSNISKTYKSKTLIVNHFCPGRLYFFKNPSESYLLWTRLLLGTWEYIYILEYIATYLFINCNS